MFSLCFAVRVVSKLFYWGLNALMNINGTGIELHFWLEWRVKFLSCRSLSNKICEDIFCVSFSKTNSSIFVLPLKCHHLSFSTFVLFFFLLIINKKNLQTINFHVLNNNLKKKNNRIKIGQTPYLLLATALFEYMPCCS